MRRKEFDPQENLKHIFFAALELWRIWQENSNEDFLFSDDFNAQIKKNLKEYKTKSFKKNWRMPFRKFLLIRNQPFLNKMNCF